MSPQDPTTTGAVPATVDADDPSRRPYPRASATGATSVPASPALPALEEAVLAYWRADATFEASLEHPGGSQEPGSEYVFYDGPPFANGLPHYGHLLTGYVKDVVPRYRTMRGQRTPRRFGWDCHGLPAEVEAERQLGITHKAQIEEMGVERFNDACRTSVLRYTDEWEGFVARQARWVDFENGYKTLDTDYMESVMWAFKTLWDRGHVYEGFRVLAYCWRCETPLSATETRMDDVYRQRQDPAVTVGFPLISGPAAGARVLVWTTTPWTLPSNLAVAVNPEVEYVVVALPDGSGGGADGGGADGGATVLLAADRLGHHARELGEDPAVLSRHTGAELVGSRYTPPFAYFTDVENAHQVVAADYVTTDDGTGAVHTAPGFGEDDAAAVADVGIATVVPVDGRGRFDARVADYEGSHVFDANAAIIADLKRRTAHDRAQGAPAAAGTGATPAPATGAVLGDTDPGPVAAGTVLLRQETYDHPYPHCWRDGTPLIYRAVSSWFVGVTRFRDRMVELNQQVDWVPGHVKEGSFGQWVAGARDWSISRNRFWGSPIPVWVSDDPAHPRTDVYGSLDELEADFGVRPADLHRPFVDALTRPNPDDPRPEGERSTMRRVPEVLDCWFESGAMPFAQVHYPFENAAWFEDHFPGDFIVEYVGQTRGWFYTMHVLATALFDRPAFRTALVHGIVLGEDGRKMSKSLRNYPDVSEVFARDGADAMRWFLMSSPVVRGGNLITTEAGIRDGVRQVLLPLWSAWSFLALYAGAMRADGQDPDGQEGDGQDGGGARGYAGTWSTGSQHTLDRWVLGQARVLVEDVTAAMDALDLAGACESVRVFLDGLTNWYVRRSRERFWGNGDDARAAVDTLHTVLEVVCRLAAPLAPLTTEEVWRGLTGGRSVHLAAWPDAGDLPGDDASRALVEDMSVVRVACSAALSLRKAAGLRVRQPLSALTVVVPGAERLRPLSALVADQVNVREVVLTDLDEAGGASHGVVQRAVVNARAAGPRLGRGVQDVIRACRAGDWSLDDAGVLTAGGVALVQGEYELVTEAAGGGDGQVVATLPDGGFVVLATEVTEELAAAGWAADVVRAVQDARKAAGLDVGDRIALALTVPHDRHGWAVEHRERIAEQVLAETVDLAAGDVAAVEVAVARRG